MGDATPAVVNTAKKIYYVLRNKSFGYVSLPKPVSTTWDPYRHVRNSVGFKQGLASATRFTNIDDLLTQYGAHGVNNGTYSSSLEIIRVEETAGVPSRRVATCSETPTGYVIKDVSNGYSSNPDTGFAEGWTQMLDKAKVFSTESDAVYGLTRRSVRLATEYRATILRVIDVPSMPVITETVLA